MGKDYLQFLTVALNLQLYLKKECLVELVHYSFYISSYIDLFSVYQSIFS
jgi:hypothetical protein